MFDSWTGDRATEYRRINHIPDEWGTAVNVQQMVFGNKGDTSGSGVAFSRDEVTGAPEPSGDFLINAQGEDVVSGVRNTLDIADLEDKMPEAHAELMEILRTLEEHYKDMQDTEFTIEEGSLFMLQTRNAKRPAQAAVRFACDAVEEELLTREEALATIDPNSLDALLHPTFDPQADFEVLATGVSASPGAAKGEIVFTAAEAVQAGEDGRDVILVRPFTEADDVAGFHAAKGILTSRGRQGLARGARRPRHGPARRGGRRRAGHRPQAEGRPRRRHGARRGRPDRHRRHERLGDGRGRPARGPRGQRELRAGARVGGRDPPPGRARERRHARGRAQGARELGAEGIGLCRTEHMFMAEDRQPKMQAMIMAERRGPRRERARPSCCRIQQEDFEGSVRGDGRASRSRSACSTRRCTSSSRTCPSCGPTSSARGSRSRDDLEDLERMLSRVEELHEEQPDARHARLPPRDPPAGDLRDAGRGDHARRQGGARPRRSIDAPHVEIMIPLVDYEQELAILRELVVRDRRRAGHARGAGRTPSAR